MGHVYQELFKPTLTSEVNLWQSISVQSAEQKKTADAALKNVLSAASLRQ